MKRKKVRLEAGQAFAEMVVCMLPMIFIFLGIVIVGALGLENLKATINARLAADCISTNGTFSSNLLEQRSAVSEKDPETIRTWDYGADRIPFTRDDAPVTDAGSVMQDFSMQSAFDTDRHSFASGPKSTLRLQSLDADSLVKAEQISDRIFGQTTQDSGSTDIARIFLGSAGLKGALVQMTGTMSRYGLNTSSSFFTSILSDSTVLTGEAFMPKRTVDLAAEEEADPGEGTP